MLILAQMGWPDAFAMAAMYVAGAYVLGQYIKRM